MVALIENNITAIRDACKKHHERTLYLVGSAATGYCFSLESDVDFLYRFKEDEIEEMEYADNFFDLMFYLQDLLKRKVDLVAVEKMKNPYFIESINKDKQLIYES
jgi:uncharacterized protein